MSGMVGLTTVSQVSHHFEDILDKIRMGKANFTPAILNLLIDGVSLLQALVKASSQGKKEPDARFFEERIRLSLTEKPKGESDDLLSQLNLSPALSNLLTEYEHHRLTQNVKVSAQLYEVIATFNLETFDIDLPKLTGKIQKETSGEVIATLPGPSPSGGMEFRLIVAIPQECLPLETIISGDHIKLRALFKKPPETAPLSVAVPVPSEQRLPVAAAQQPLPEPTTQSISDEVPLQGEEATMQELESIRSLSQTVRVDIEKLDLLLNMVGELVISKGQIGQISRKLLDQDGLSPLALEVQRASKMLDKRISAFQEKLVEVRMTPIGQIFERLVRVVNRVSKDLGKEVHLLFSGEETRMDKSMVEDLADPLLHLILNALDHGLEGPEERALINKPVMGTIMVRAAQNGNHVVVEVEDDGRGIDSEKIYEKGLKKGMVVEGKQYSQNELVKLLFLPGFSTKDKVSEISGRGVGLDVVAKNISRLSGMVDIETIVGKGTLFTLTLPITLVIIKALIVHVGNETFAIPLSSVLESLMISKKEIKTIEAQEVIQLREHTLMLIRLKDLFELEYEESSREMLYVIVVGLVEKRMGLIVSDIRGQQEIVVKSLGEELKNLKGISGVTEIGDGKAVLVLDVAALIQEVTEKMDDAGVGTLQEH
jgi:two-component system chemotaxis sensor kinase CheA